MIEQINPKKYYRLVDLVEFINNQADPDFHFTKDNTRIYVNDEDTLKKFLRESSCAFVCVEQGEYRGVVIVWKSDGGGTKRYYVKLIADSPKVAVDLLTILTWNVKKDLHVKIRKNSEFVNSFRYKGFRFCGARGSQILLERKYIPFEVKYYEKEGDSDDSQ